MKVEELENLIMDKFSINPQIIRYEMSELKYIQRMELLIKTGSALYLDLEYKLVNNYLIKKIPVNKLIDSKNSIEFKIINLLNLIYSEYFIVSPIQIISPNLKFRMLHALIEDKYLLYLKDPKQSYIKEELYPEFKLIQINLDSSLEDIVKILNQEIPSFNNKYIWYNYAYGDPLMY